MPTNKDSKRSKTDKKKVLSTKKTSKPLKKQGVQKVFKPVVNAKSKRPAKRKAATGKGNRVQRQYDIVRGIVADYCKRNYGRRCSRSESKEIYQSLKRRFLDENLKTTMSLDDIRKDIDKVLAYKGRISPPASVTTPMPYFEVVSSFFEHDGGYFQDDDTLIFDLTTIGEGKVKTPYADLPYAYKTDIYERIRGWIMDVKAEGITISDDKIEFVYDADKSNETNRVFVWKLNLDKLENKEEKQTTKEIKEGKEEQERNLKYNKKKAKEEIQEIKEDIDESRDALAIEKEKTKQKELEKDIEEKKLQQKLVERQLKAMKLLEKGLITSEQFAQLIAGI